ncbi:MAG TPA: hypothetical protein VNO30_03090 [Kofleriaceae bacterium]|nr:hypothetical protein [Kofleriaceae bacterium]
MMTMTMTRTRLYLTTLLAMALIPALIACTPEDGDMVGSDKTSVSEPDNGEPGREAPGPYDHESLLAPPATEAVPEGASPELLAELERLPVPYDRNHLPVIYDKDGKLRVAEQPVAVEPSLNNADRNLYVVGGGDWVTYHYIELPLPSYMTDFDGGTIRLIMQHELDSYDQVRIIDEHIGTEYADNSYGARGRFPGRYGWTRQSGGGDLAWILGDGTPHNLANPWDWAWVLDYRWLQGNSVLGGDYIRIYSHPHVTTRVVFVD